MIFNWKIYILTVFIIFFTACVPKTSQIVKQTSNNDEKKIKYCKEREKIMLHASRYIIEEFDKGYFLKKDIVGAKAQLFLIKKKSPTIFAENINAANDSYEKQFELARKYGCNIEKYKIFPLEGIETALKNLENKK